MELLKKETYNKIKDRFLLQKGFDEAVFEKEVSFAIQHLSKNQLLQECSVESVLRSVLNVSQTGLTLNPVSKYAYLVPRYNTASKCYECVLDPSYIGLSKLLTDSGAVVSINCQLVYHGDDIEVDMSSAQKIIKHVPYLFTGKEKGEVLCVYSLAELSSGEKHCEIMSIQDVYQIRDRSESFKAFTSGKIKSCVWTTDLGQMIRKTCIKRHYNQLPKTGNLSKLEHAVNLSNESSGLLLPVSYNSLALIESLIPYANLTEDEKSKMMKELELIEYEYQASKMISYLKKNEPILGEERFPKSMKEIMDLAKQKASLD